jgi:YegS/Rv2252/BmrU family lipid kinase
VLNKRNILAIVNPFSGTKNKEKIVKLLERHLTVEGISYQHIYTEYSGHAIELAKNAVRKGMDTIIAVGGDGTISEVSSQLIGSATKLGIISLGSGNGFARHLNIHKSIPESVTVIKSDAPVLIDSCILNGRPYINVAGIGLDGKVAYVTKTNTQRGLLPYVLSSLKAGTSYKAFEAELCYNDKCTFGEYKAIVVANGPLYGFNFQIAPKASVNDGLLDVMLFKNFSFLKYSAELPKFIQGNLHKSKYVELIKTPRLSVKLQQKEYAHVDGEGMYTNDLEYIFEINPNSLRVLV